MPQTARGPVSAVLGSEQAKPQVLHDKDGWVTKGFKKVPARQTFAPP